MLEAAKCCYKDFESHFSRSFKIAAGFQFYLHFPWGLQSAEGWPAEKISKLNWNVFGEKRETPRGKIKLYSFLLEEMPKKKHETWMALVRRVLQFEGTIWSIIGHCPETSPFPFYLSTISFRPLAHIEIFWQTVVRYSPRDLWKLKYFTNIYFCIFNLPFQKKIADCAIVDFVMPCWSAVQIYE